MRNRNTHSRWNYKEDFSGREKVRDMSDEEYNKFKEQTMRKLEEHRQKLREINNGEHLSQTGQQKGNKSTSVKPD